MILRAIVAAVLVAATYALQLPLALGAHPFWAGQVVLVGGGIGLLVAVAPWPSPTFAKAIALLALGAAAFGLANYGKTQFAASYAEDAVAGKIWFFGWHVACACLVAGIATAIAAKWSGSRA